MIMENLEIKNFGLKMHLNMSNMGIRTDGGEIVCPHHTLNDKTLCRQVTTSKSKNGVWGTGTVKFYIDGQKEEFETIDDLLNHYNLPKLKPKSNEKQTP